MKKIITSYLSPLVILCVFSSLITSCGSSAKKVGDYTPRTNLSGLKFDSSQMPVMLFKRPGAPELGTYSNFFVQPIIFNSKDESLKKIPKKDLIKLRKYFHKAITKELEDNGYSVVKKPESNTMRMSFIVSGIKAPSALPNVVSAVAPVTLSVGEVVVEAVFKNAGKNRTDAVVVSKGAGSHIMNTTPWSTWADIEATFKQWAGGIRESIDKTKR